MAPAAGHRIRLRGPWKIERRLGSDREFRSVETRKHPDEWTDVVQAGGGRVRMSRVFHAPTNVAAKETVFVVLTGVCGEGLVSLNGTQIGRFTLEQAAGEFAVPFELPYQNELSIDVTYPAPSKVQEQVGVYDVVALEIRPSDS